LKRRLSAGLDDVAVVGEPVEERIDHLGVAEDGRPPAGRCSWGCAPLLAEAALAKRKSDVAADSGEDL
jgi:hypothetical protein